MKHDPELTEAGANVTATMRRLIDDLGAKPITPKRFRYTVCEPRSMADNLSHVADAAEARERDAGGDELRRVPEHDRRISRGDDFAGDAWLDQETGSIVWGAVGVDRRGHEQ